MIQVRYNVFETNSSSTHSMVICSDKSWNKLKNNELFIDVFAAEDGKTKLVTEDVLLKEAEKDYMKFDYDPESITSRHLKWDELYNLYLDSEDPHDKKVLKTHNINLFGTAGERFINPNSSVWEGHKVKKLENGKVQIDFDHFFG